MSESTATAIVPGALAPLSIKDSVLAQFKEAETTITTLATKYTNVAYAVGTPSGMREAVAARADLRDNGRLFVTRAENRIKGEVNDLKRVMASEVERLVAIVKPVEDAVDAQIKAEEKRKADEKEKREKLEADRTGKHRENIDKIKGYVAAAEGKALELIERGTSIIAAMTFGPEWEEFAAEASAARDAAVEGLNRLASVERQRLENERLQKELADARAALAAAAPAPATAAEPVATQPAVETPAAAPVATPARHFGGYVASTSRQTSAPAPVVSQPVNTSPVVSQKADAVEDNGVRLKLGQINEFLAPINLTADGLTELGFPPAGKDGAAKLYRECDFAAICEALIQHVTQASELMPA